MHEGLREIVETHEALTEPVDVSMHGKDGGVWKWRVQPERRAEFANAATAKAQSVARTAAQYQSAIEDCINTLSATVDSKLTNPRRDAAAVAGEAPQIRDYVRALPPAERLQFLVTCITDGDFAEVTAVLGASPYSSGLTKKDMAVIRQQAEKRWAPREAAQRDAAIVALEQIKSAQQLFDTKFVAMLPKPDETTKGERALKRLKGEKESA